MLGIIRIDKIGVDEMIVAGVRASDLDEGVGHYPYTPLPGNVGNTAIAGHRTTHGQPFFNLDELAAGDEITVQTLQGIFVYSVTGSKIVPPTDFTVLASDPEQSTLTLTTCHPRYSQKQRLVVRAELVPERSTIAGGVVLDYDPAAVDAATQEEQPTEATIVGEEEPTVGESSSTTAAATGGSSTTDGVPPSTEASTPAAETQDAFSSGWFSDPKAWPHVAAWGAALLVIWLLGKWIGRRTRRWFGPIAIAAPFVVLLYFWFENVSRGCCHRTSDQVKRSLEHLSGHGEDTGRTHLTLRFARSVRPPRPNLTVRARLPVQAALGPTATGQRDRCAQRSDARARSTTHQQLERARLGTVDTCPPSGATGICVGAGPGTPEQVFARMPVRGEKLCYSNVGLLRSYGYDVIRPVDETETQRDAHAVLLLEAEPSGADWDGWERLRLLFEGPRLIQPLTLELGYEL